MPAPTPPLPNEIVARRDLNDGYLLIAFAAGGTGPVAYQLQREGQPPIAVTIEEAQILVAMVHVY